MTDQTASQTAQAQATSDGGQATVQPTAEERLKQIETEKAELAAKYEASVREMNEKQRRSAELEAKLAAEETMRSTFQAQLAQFQTKADPTVELQQQIKQAQDEGDSSRASALMLQFQNQKAAEMVQATATIGLMNSVNQALMNPNFSEETKQVIREKVFEGGDPKRNIRQDKYGELLGMAVKPGAFDEFINDARQLAEGRKVLSGKTKEQLFQEWTAEQEKRKKEAEMASSLTQPGTGAPPLQPTKEQADAAAKTIKDKILNAKYPD